jgi:aspartate/methionine/tyrosine aminotransferase
MPEFDELFSLRTRWNLAQNRLTQLLADLKAQNRRILDLTISNPTECGFAYPHGKIRQALTEPDIFRYRPDPRGLRCAREAVVSYYQERHASLAAEDLVLTAGTSEGYSFLFRLLCNPGDQVLIPLPGYPLLDFLADLCDVSLVRYPLVYDLGWQIDFPALAAAVADRTRAVIAVHPNNPTGHFCSSRERERLSRFCAERGLALIVDEVFLDFGHNGVREGSFAALDQALTFTVSGLSKICGLPQMKFAWIALSGPVDAKREALGRLEVTADAYLSVGTPVQLAAPYLLETREGFRKQALARVAANFRELDAQLSRQSACSRLQCDAGWATVLRVPALQSDEELAIALLQEKGVSVHPGHLYDFAQTGHMVVSLIVPETEFAAGIARVLEYFG